MAEGGGHGRDCQGQIRCFIFVWSGVSNTRPQLYHQKQAPPIPSGITLSALADDFRQRCFAVYVFFFSGPRNVS